MVKDYLLGHDTSFKVSIDAPLEEQLIHPEFWPQHFIDRYFNFKRKKIPPNMGTFQEQSTALYYQNASSIKNKVIVIEVEM